MDATSEMSRARKHKPRTKSSGTLDSLGGGNILRADNPDNKSTRAEDREDKRKYSSSGTLDSIGVGHLLRAVDREDKRKYSPSGTLDPIAGGHLQRAVDRGDKQKYSSSGTLDSIGGGHLLKAVDREDKQKYSSSGTLDSIGGGHLLRAVDREDKHKYSSSGTLDPIGGGHLLRIVDNDVETGIFISLEPHFEKQDDSAISLARKDKQKPSSSGTLDPIGGGNLVRITDSEAETAVLSSLVSPSDSQGDSTVSFAHKDKQKPSSSGTLNPIGGGNLIGITDPEAETGIFSSLASPRDNQGDRTISLARKDKKKPSSSGTLDPIGGGNLVRITDPEVETGVPSSLASPSDSQDDNTISLARKDKQKPSSSGTLDPIGGGNLVRITDPEAETGVLSSLVSPSDSQGRQNMMRLARDDKSSQSRHALDGLGGGTAGQYRAQFLRSPLTDSLDQGGDVMRMLDSISGSELLSSLDSAEGMAVLSALRKTHTKYPKRMLDSVSGWAFGESKRNFDEIDNVGFTGFAKRSPRYRQLALAKKNFDEIDRAGFETYNKRDFDEIDRAGFETFEKRDRKE